MDISVILFYNVNRGWLDEARESYLSQIFKGTSELIEIHGKRSVSQNINIGIRKAKGKYVKMLCEDDTLTANCLQALFDKAEEGYDLVCANAVNCSMTEKTTELVNSSLPGRVFELAENNTIHGGTVLYLRDALIKVGMYDEKLLYAEEFELHLRMASFGMRFGYVDEPVYIYRLHEHQKSMQGGYRDGEAYLRRKRYILHEVQERYMNNFNKIRQ